MLKKLMPVLFSLVLVSATQAQTTKYDIQNISHHALKKIITAVRAGAQLRVDNQSSLGGLELVLEYGNREIIIGVVGTVAFFGAVSLILTNRSDVNKIVDSCPRIWSWGNDKKKATTFDGQDTVQQDTELLHLEDTLNNLTDDNLRDLLEKDLELD